MKLSTTEWILQGIANFDLTWNLYIEKNSEKLSDLFFDGNVTVKLKWKKNMSEIECMLISFYNINNTVLNRCLVKIILLFLYREVDLP